MATNCMFMCELCCAVFTKSSNLRRHTKNVHFPERKFMCEHCSKSYNTKCSLMRHITSNHTDRLKKKRIVYWQCPICVYENEKEIMLEHYGLVHSIDTSSTTMKFKTFDEFQSWKQSMETGTCSKYIRYRNKKCSDKMKYFYRCHRDGVYKGRGNNIRKLKKIGSNKINAHCPAKIDVTIFETTGAVSIKYMKSHVGHTMESSITDETYLSKKQQKQNQSSEPLIYDEKVSNKIKMETATLDLDKKETAFISKYKESNETVLNIEAIKMSLLHKFQFILREVENYQKCIILTNELLRIENILQDYKKC